MLDQTKPSTTLIDLNGVCRSFPKGSGEDLRAFLTDQMVPDILLR